MKKARIFILLLLPAVVLTAGCGGGKARVGKPLPAWSEGCLDIHAVNTARGECTFLILPDGTTLTVDAGEFSSEPKKYRSMPQKPDSLTRPTRTYARYMRHFMPYKDSLDYFLLTHFHMDHLGQLEPEYGRSAVLRFQLPEMVHVEMGQQEVVERILVRHEMPHIPGVGAGRTREAVRLLGHAAVLFRFAAELTRIHRERRAVGQDEESALPAGRVDGVDVQTAFAPRREGFADPGLSAAASGGQNDRREQQQNEYPCFFHHFLI